MLKSDLEGALETRFNKPYALSAGFRLPGSTQGSDTA